MEQMEVNKMVDHLFRHESGKIVGVLARIFGPENLDLAEDVVQDSLVEAIRQWEYQGIPSEPSAWIFRVAKNKALNIVNREKYRLSCRSDVIHLLQSEWTAEPAMDHLFSEKEILDDQLRMMFTCCHPSISSDSQVALILKTLCGFSIPEIAKAFITSEENINKRLVRARKRIRESKIPLEVPGGSELKQRLETVLQTIYLLFNEGYSASVGADLIRYEVCEEAIRLADIILRHPAIEDRSEVYAILALMQLNASRFGARQDAMGNILTLEYQDRALWDRKLMEKGCENLEKAAKGQEIGVYHLLAAISFYHCVALDYPSTDWESILGLYDRLIQLDPTPVMMMNRCVALSKVHGPEASLSELERLRNSPSLSNYYLFYSVQAECYLEMGRNHEACEMLEKAWSLAPLDAEKAFLRRKLEACGKK